MLAQAKKGISYLHRNMKTPTKRSLDLATKFQRQEAFMIQMIMLTKYDKQPEKRLYNYFLFAFGVKTI